MTVGITQIQSQDCLINETAVPSSINTMNKHTPSSMFDTFLASVGFLGLI